MTMRWLNVLVARLRALWRRDAVLDDIDEELLTHVDIQTEVNVAAGMAPGDARRAALASFGDLRGIRDSAFKIRGGGVLDTALQDFRIGARMLVRRPGFTIVAVLTLALGIGANTAVFSAVNAVLLRPLGFSEPERLMLVWLKGPEAAGGDRMPLSVADLLDWRAQNRTFESVAAFRPWSYHYTGGEEPQYLRAVSVTANFFSTLGVAAELGRTFAPGEERPGAAPVVVVSHRFWRDQLGADPAALNSALKLDDTIYTVVGVMPAAFDFPEREVELWTALHVEPLSRRGPFFLRGVGRLRPGATPEQAREDLDTIAARIAGEPPGFSGGFNVVPVRDFLVGDVRPALLLLLGAVTLVLLIAAVNVANLQLVRVAGREKEIALRAALGASPRRMVRQLFTESILLASLGGVGGLLLAFAGVGVLTSISLDKVPRLRDAGVDPVVLGWTAAVSLASGVIFGLVPALQSRRLNLHDALKEGRRGLGDGSGRRRLRSALVICEVALALMLLVGAGLLIKSLWLLHRAEPGFTSDRVLIATISTPESSYGDGPRVVAFYQQLLARLTALPGVESAAVANGLPPDQWDWSDNFTIDGMPLAPRERAPVATRVEASPDYFRTLNVRLRSGRPFDAADAAGSPRVTIINESLARLYLDGHDPIGRIVRMGPPGLQDPAMRIVGVAADVKYGGLERAAEPTIYVPAAQGGASFMHLVIKTRSEPLELAGAVGREVSALDRNVPVVRVTTLDDRVKESIAQPRFRTLLIAVFSALALLLAGVGVYGVMAYAVAQRRHEIGTRVALGARTRDVLWLVVGQGMALALCGIAIGLAAAVAVGRALTSLLFGVSATDPAVLVGATLLIAAVSLVACSVPALRAARVDPMVALRCE